MESKQIDILDEFILWVHNNYGVVRIESERYPQVSKYINDNWPRLLSQGTRRSARVGWLDD